MVVALRVCPCFARSISGPTRVDRRRPVSTTGWPRISSQSLSIPTSVVRPEPSAPSRTMRWPRRCSEENPGGGVPWVLRMDQRLRLREVREERSDLPPDLLQDVLDGVVGVQGDEPVQGGDPVVLALEARLEPLVALLEVVGEPQVHAGLVEADLLAREDLAVE